jgi:hypothetical protein
LKVPLKFKISFFVNLQKFLSKITFNCISSHFKSSPRSQLRHKRNSSFSSHIFAHFHSSISSSFKCAPKKIFQTAQITSIPKKMILAMRKINTTKKCFMFSSVRPWTLKSPFTVTLQMHSIGYFLIPLSFFPRNFFYFFFSRAMAKINFEKEIFCSWLLAILCKCNYTRMICSWAWHWSGRMKDEWMEKFF